MNRIALVIGNSKYMNVNQLKNPQNDANDMAIILDKLGFKVIKYLDLNLIQIENAVRQFLIELDEYSAGLFYYAGHGMQIDGKNYIVPIDCEIRDKTYTILSSFDICKYLDGLSLYKGKTNICILDACRDNPFATSLRDIANGFAPFNTQPKGTIIAYSTSPDKGASDGKGCNGLYTQVLKETIPIPNLKIEDMFKAVRIRVMELSGETQISWEHSSLVGDFYFSVKEQSVVKNVSDETIFDYIKEHFRYYESVTDDIYDAECMPYVDAYIRYRIPIIKLLRAYSRIQYKKEGKAFSDNDIDQINIGYLESWGFKRTNGRWYYKDNYVEMGDPLPLSNELAPLKPLLGKEMKIDGSLSCVINENKVIFKLISNMPDNTPLIYTLRGKDYSAQSKCIVEKNVSMSEGFSNKGKLIDDGFYKLEVSCPIYDVLPENVKLVFGERNRNLIGGNIKFDPIGGNTIRMIFNCLMNDKNIVLE